MADDVLEKVAEEVSVDLATAIADLQQNISKSLSPRIRAITHTVTCNCAGVTLYVHYPSFRSTECTVKELVDVVTLFLVRFALPRRRVRELWAKKDRVDAEEYDLLQAALRDEAYALFKKAHETTKRNGEAGELLLYLLTEWVLGAPQILAKMSLKTNPEMPVYGSDGVHVRYNSDLRKLEFLWGESKIHASVSGAIAAAAKSISTSLLPEKVKHELFLIERDIDLSGLDDPARVAFKKYLNPMEDESNEWVSRVTCLVGFDFAGYEKVKASPLDQVEENFKSDLLANLPQMAEDLDSALRDQGLEHQRVDVFFFPFPSVDKFRNLFQDKIGWRKANADGNTK